MAHSASVLPCQILLTKVLSIRIMKSANMMFARFGLTLMVKFAGLLKHFFPIAMISKLLQSVSEMIPSVQVTKVIAYLE